MGPESSGADRWREHPILGASLQGLLTVVPLVLGSAAGVVVARWWVPTDRTGSWLATWALAGTVAMLTVWSLQPVTRRLVPLAWLLRLGMLWPGRAPSRFKVARSAGRLTDLEERVRRAREVGVHGEPERAAEMVLMLTAALTAHDRRTRGHAERVRIFTDLLALELGLPRADRDRLRWAALLHDIGKLDVPERLLNKPAKPSRREWETLRAHPAAGHRILEPLRTWLGEWGDTALHHHERWDGTGYPQGLSGSEICRGGRIVAVADAYEVMTAPRSYKRPMGTVAARHELVAYAGKQFDPGAVRAFLLIPVWRLRWALGPFSWVAQLPVARDMAHASGTLSTGAVTAGAGAAGAAAITLGATLQPAPSTLDAATARAPADTSVTSEPLSWRGAADATIASGLGAGHGADTHGPGEDEVETPDLVGDDADAGDPEPATDGTGRAGGPPGDGEHDRLRDEEAGPAANPPGTVGRVVEGAVSTADGVVEETTGAAGQVVEDVADEVGKVVDGTKKTLDGGAKDVLDGAPKDALDEVTKGPVDDLTKGLGDGGTPLDPALP